ncbi:MAG: oligopeptidase B, partial [Candidatus Zixiibacteriota bacterium]
MLAKKKLIISVFVIGLLNLILLWLSGYADKQDIAPPVAKVIPKADTLYGDVRIDNYFWLREKSNPEVIKYLEAENEYTEAMMKHTEEFQERLYQELLGRIKETDLSVPERIDDYYYYSRTEEGKQYPIYCRKKGGLDAEEEILLDQNELAEGYDYFDIGAFEISTDHQLLAYSVDTAGSEMFTLYIKDLNTGELFGDEIENTYYSVKWANDNKTVFYTTLDKAKRPYKLYRHILGTPQKEDKMVYHEKDEAFFVYLSKTRSKKYFIMTSESQTTTEVWYLEADFPEDNFKVIHPRQHKMEYYIAHRGDKFYILTNDQAKNFRLMEASVTDPSKKNWKELIPHRDSVKIDGMDAFENHLVVYERERGLKKLRITNLTDGQVHYVDFPEPVYTFWRSRNPEFNTNLLRFNYSSLVTPRSVFDYNMDTKVRELKKRYEVLGGYDPSLYQS